VSVRNLTPTLAVEGEQALKDSRRPWKLVILLHLFGGYCVFPILSERSRPGISLSPIAGQSDPGLARRRGCSGEDADTNILPVCLRTEQNSTARRAQWRMTTLPNSWRLAKWLNAAFASSNE
jgi:hypothetical protein